MDCSSSYIASKHFATQQTSDSNPLSTLNNEEYFVVLSDIDIGFSSCQCKNNRNNDLAAYVRRLVDEGKITTSQMYALSEHLVENHNCPMAMKYHLESKHSISTGYAVGAQWELIGGKDASKFHNMVNGLFNTLYEEAPGTCDS